MFFALAAIVATILTLVCLLLSEGHKPDPDISLRPAPILAEYLAITAMIGLIIVLSGRSRAQASSTTEETTPVPEDQADAIRQDVADAPCPLKAGLAKYCFQIPS